MEVRLFSVWKALRLALTYGHFRKHSEECSSFGAILYGFNLQATGISQCLCQWTIAWYREGRLLILPKYLRLSLYSLTKNTTFLYLEIETKICHLVLPIRNLRQTTALAQSLLLNFRITVHGDHTTVYPVMYYTFMLIKDNSIINSTPVELIPSVVTGIF